MNGRNISHVLGWFSVGLGAAELLAPRKVGRGIGVGLHTTTLRLLAAREIASGIGLLTQKRSKPWLWSRVIGDAMDLALLAGAFSGSRRPERLRIAAAAAGVAGVAALDIMAARRMSYEERNGTGLQRPKAAAERSDHAHRSILINRTPEEVFLFWRRLEPLPEFMDNLVSVTVLDGKRSRWVAKGPAGKLLEWDAEIINEEPNELIAWRSLPGADIQQAGTVRFERAPGNRGTIVRVKMQYDPPGGAVGAKIARLFGRAPEQQIATDLRRLKQLMETGEIATTAGQPAGRRSSVSKRYDQFANRFAAV